MDDIGLVIPEDHCLSEGPNSASFKGSKRKAEMARGVFRFSGLSPREELIKARQALADPLEGRDGEWNHWIRIHPRWYRRVASSPVDDPLRRLLHRTCPSGPRFRFLALADLPDGSKVESSNCFPLFSSFSRSVSDSSSAFCKAGGWA
jgi:hypothetical protein